MVEKYINRFLVNVFCILMGVFIGHPCFALQNTINMPNSDVLNEGVILLKDVSSVYPDKKSGTTIPSINYGIGHGTEISIGVPVTMKFPNSTFTTKMAVEAKHVIYLYDKTNRITFGGGIFPYLNGGTTEGFFYGHVTKIISKTKTSFSIGGYTTGDKEFINSGGMLMILEQDLNKNLKLLGEYTTGNNSRSNFAVGIKYKPVNDFALTGAVIVPNNENGVGFQVILSKFFRK